MKKKKKKIDNVKTEENRETFDSFIPAKDDRCMYVMWCCCPIILIKKKLNNLYFTNKLFCNRRRVQWFG